MPNPPKKFNSVRATRLSLLMALSLTVGIGISIYAPLAHVRPAKAGVQQNAQAVDTGSALPTTARLPEPLLAPKTWQAAPLVTSVGSAAAPQGARQDATAAGIVPVPNPSVSQESVPTAPERVRPAQEERSEGHEGEAQTGSAPMVRLVRVTQRTLGFAGGTVKRSVTPRLTRRATPSPVVTGKLPPRLATQPAATVVRQVVPKVVRRPTAPVIATTSAS